MRILVEKMGTADGRLLSGGDENTSKWLDDYLWLLWGAWQEEDDVADAADARLRANAAEDCILFLAAGSRRLWISLLVSCCCYIPSLYIWCPTISPPPSPTVESAGPAAKKGESWGRVCDVIPTNTYYNRTWALLKHFSLLCLKAWNTQATAHGCPSVVVRMLYNIRSVE